MQYLNRDHLLLEKFLYSEIYKENFQDNLIYSNQYYKFLVAIFCLIYNLQLHFKCLFKVSSKLGLDSLHEVVDLFNRFLSNKAKLFYGDPGLIH